MAQLTELRSIIDEELQDIYVTNRLRKITLNQIFKSQTNFWAILKRDWMKLTTVFSVLIIVLTLGVNYTLNVTEPPQVSPKSEPYIMQLKLSNPMENTQNDLNDTDVNQESTPPQE